MVRLRGSGFTSGFFDVILRPVPSIYENRIP